MKQDAPQSIFEEFQIEISHTKPAHEHDSKRGEPTFYARSLRTLGQILEDYSIRNPTVRISDGHYMIHGLKDRPTPFIGAIRCWFYPNHSNRKLIQNGEEVKFEITDHEIDSAETINQRKRRTPGQMPDAYSLSQILRGVGFYLDTRDRSVPLRLSIENEFVSLEFKTYKGEIKKLDVTLQFVYDYWVHMYLRRRERWKTNLFAKPHRLTLYPTMS